MKQPKSCIDAKHTGTVSNTCIQQCNIVCFDACTCALAASLNPTYTYGAQKEGSMSPPPAPSISALQVSTTRWTSAVCQGQCTSLQGSLGLAEGSQSCSGWQSRLYVGVRCIPGTASGLASCASCFPQAVQATGCPMSPTHSWRAGCLTASLPLPTDRHTCQACEQQRRRRPSGEQEHEENLQQQGPQPDRSADVRPATHARGGPTGALNAPPRQSQV